MYFTDQNTKQMGEPWNEILRYRWDKATDRAQKVDEKNGVKMFKKIYIQSYGY